MSAKGKTRIGTRTGLKDNANEKMTSPPPTEKNDGKGRSWIAAGVLIAVVAAAVAISAREFVAMWEDPPIYPGPGITEQFMLSSIAPELAGSAADTEVYVLDGDSPGGTLLILGGTHPNEPASSLTAITIIENAVVNEGRLLVIPRANHSAFTCTDPQEGAPQTYVIETPGGDRLFRYGSRATNPIDQWPDPVIYVGSSGQALAGAEVRNLNRSYPGDSGGYLTEKLAAAILDLIRTENVDLAIDLHEASPEYPVINAIVAHENALPLAVEAALFLEFEGIQIGVEASPINLRGLSHREWGDATDTLALLIESTNPAQGRLRGAINSELILEGADPYYIRAAGQGLLYVPFSDAGHPIEERVGRHLDTIAMLTEIYSSQHGDQPIRISGLPTLSDLSVRGLGTYLDPSIRETDHSPP